MKTSHLIWIVGILAAVLTDECHAHFDGCDDFNDNSIDPTRWGAVVVLSGSGLLTGTNQRLEFTTSAAPSSDDVAVLPWILNTGSYSEDWELKADLNIGMPASTNVPQPILNLVLLVSARETIDPTNDMLLIAFYQDISRGILSQVVANGVQTMLGRTNTESTNVSVRILFDSSAKVLSAFVDENGAYCGYAWELLGSTIVPASWGMTTNTFHAFLLGTAHHVAIASTNNVFADNFCASSGATPKLGISLTGGNVVLAWSTNGPACQLEFAAALTPPVCWQSVTNAPGIVSTNFTVTNATSSDKGFYRLRR